MQSVLPMKAGVCYYPEHWPEVRWPDDARHMREIGISVVRIGEFAWSRLEPTRGQFDFAWLERAIDTLHKAGLEVVMGTPTATPPKWLINEHPDILAVDEHGATRGFGSRRHYCFSSLVYRDECKRIVTAVAKHFGNHPAITAWQTDNEYGCHSTIASFSNAALLAFRQWCQQRYPSIEDLNRQWGNVFWSMEYRNFDEIDLPCGAVTELNPAHRLAFWRFSSDQVVSFNQLQVELLRQYAPGRDILHNYMGNFTEFDHHAVGRDLDIATWDNYPLGFLDRDSDNEADKKKWYRTGHPDSSAFHHDLYRGVGRGRWWVIEQQPGPVNWAPHNPSPLPGMVRLWAWEAMAHGAEVMAWFRWRQAPFAQEQFHAGLLLPNGEEDAAVAEVRQFVAEQASLLDREDSSTLPAKSNSAKVAILFDYTGDQVLRIQAQGVNFDIGQWTQQLYTACRRCGVNVDIVAVDADLSAYKLLILANTAIVSNTLVSQLKNSNATIVIGPRCGSKNDDYCIPPELPPGALHTLIPLKVTRVESLPDFATLAVISSGSQYTAWRWRELIDSTIEPAGVFDDGWGFHYQHQKVHYLNCCLDEPSLNQFIKNRLKEAGLTIVECSEGFRLRRHGAYRIGFNFGPDTINAPIEHEPLMGKRLLAPGDVAVWKI